ncbi:MAG TPA: dTMP kinase, partial [Nitrospiraceae bacterium]|nr:dTMP kinase [Nitrospiraceae bacterium]
LLREDGHRVVETREPGGTPFAERIRELLLSSTVEPITPECEAFLILACRSQHVAHVIKPALKEGSMVLCDRFSDSTLAYQGYARGLDLRLLRKLNRFATSGLTPDLTLLFDVPVPLGLARRHRHKTEQNRLDRESRRFHERVRQGFLDLAARYPHRIRVIDGIPDPENVAAEVAPIVRQYLKTRRTPKIRKP